MAMLPFLVKLACFAAVVVYIEREHMWLTGIVMLPALFLEGWFLSHWARTIMTGTHRWPFRPTGNEKKDVLELMSRSRGIILGTVSFVVINYLFFGYQAFMMSALPEDFDPQNPDGRFTIVAFVVALSAFFLFRYLWLYIPLSINAPIERVLKIVEPIKLSFSLIALWLVCAVPAFILFQVLASGFAPASAEGAADISVGAQTGFVVLQVIANMLKNVLATAGFAYAFLKLLK